ncbi:hypothetical protein GCM10012284_03970 [Mangrovihabitans endophyticus]|uniref:Uncharacterized protein n=2 Tax=Mangrovihabitans endophyticus TaxID=1751298 RepID=A0A8J3BVW2_9ACTN|nr:hypothetical protein GCM10012284_03970 [Mangrovihabitans endophyticus]
MPLSEHLLPWLLAKNLFRPYAADSSVPTGVDRLRRWRANLGALAIIVLSLPYQTPHDILDGFLERSAVNVTIAIVTAVALGGLLVVCVSAASPPARQNALHRAKQPAKRVLAAIGMWLGAVVLSVTPMPAVLRIPVLGWYVLFLLTGLFYLARYLFGTEELHPLLGPVVGSVVVTAVTAVGVLSASGGGLPARVALTIAVGGWLTSMVLSVIEAWQHRRTATVEFFWDKGAYRDRTATAAAREPDTPPVWQPIEIPSTATPIRSIDSTRRYRRSNGSPATPLLLGEAVDIAMEMDHRWNATHQPGSLRSRDGDVYQINTGAAAMAYEAVSMLLYRMVIVPARHNVSEWLRLSGLPRTWRSSPRLAAAIGRFADGRWQAAPLPPGWPPWAQPMDDATAEATAWALTVFPEDDIWTRPDLVDLDQQSYRSVKPWAFPTDRRVTVRFAMALSHGSSPAARSLLAVDAGLRDGGHDWSRR